MPESKVRHCQIQAIEFERNDEIWHLAGQGNKPISQDEKKGGKKHIWPD